MPPKPAEVRRWLDKALNDWSAARRLFAPGARGLDTVGFHCQQAVEKLLKAYLLANDVEFEKTHDLHRLLRQCAACDTAFETFRTTVPPLTLYEIAFRYPGPAEPERGQVAQALAVVDRMWQFVTARLPADEVPPMPEEW